MPRINLDLDFLDHPKTLTVSPLAQLLFIRSLIWSARHLTDGKIPKSAARMLTYDFYCPIEDHVPNCLLDLVSELISVGWWEEKDDQYDIHDYLDYQLSRKQVSQLSEKRRKIGQKGGIAKAKQTASKPLAKVYPLTNPNPNPNLKEKEKNIVRSREQAAIFWKLYKPNPRKVGKGAVEKWFIKHHPTESEFEQMCERLSTLNNSTKWAEDGGQWIPAPMTWLNQQRWKDELVTDNNLFPCQARIQDGRFLGYCGKPAVTGKENTARCESCSAPKKIVQPEPNAAILEGVTK